MTFLEQFMSSFPLKILVFIHKLSYSTVFYVFLRQSFGVCLKNKKKLNGVWKPMISDEQLDEYRVHSTVVRVIRDADPVNDVKGVVVAWDEEQVMIRKQNRRLVKLDRSYVYQPFGDKRPDELSLPDTLI
jgi:hypothetical protein